MNTEVCWFSGTGNSLAIAKDINSRFKGTLINIAISYICHFSKHKKGRKFCSDLFYSSGNGDVFV